MTEPTQAGPGREGVSPAAGATNGTPDRAQAGTDVRALAERLVELAEKATPGPWAWESVAEKSNEFAVGQAWDANGRPIGGRIPDGEWIEEEVITRGALIGMNESGHASFADAAYIAAAHPDAVKALATAYLAERAGRERAEGEREKWRIASRVLCSAHVGVPQAACPVCALDAAEARATELSAEVEALKAEARVMAEGIAESVKRWQRAIDAAEAERNAALARVREVEALKALVLDLQAHANEEGWQDVDDPIARLLEWGR